MIGVLALQNRFSNTLANSASTDLEWNEKQAMRLKIMFTIAAGLLLSILYTMLAEKLGPWSSHHSSAYITMGIAFPFYLLAVGRASSLRYPITITAAAYMLAMLIPSWILPLFPATPRLGPVLNPVTHYQAFLFPLLLVIPGFVLDKLLHRFGQGKLNDWLLAALTGTVFILVITVVQWYFGGFLQTSPHAVNWFFLADSTSYSDDPTSPYQHAFHPYWLQSTAQFLKGISIAILCAIVSARIGLLWGNWMKRVQR
jgi:hypothetical protein